MGSIHPTAIIDKEAQIDASVEVGPYCVVAGKVSIGKNCKLGPFTLINGPTTIGANNHFYAHASIGGDSQDKKGNEGSLEIGDNNLVREFVTINRGTSADTKTQVGSNNWIMAYSHIAHECIIGDNTVIANACQLAGHVSIASNAILGGGVLIHQFCRVGNLAIIGGGTVLRLDVPPYANYTETANTTSVGINKVGLARAGKEDEVEIINTAFKLLYRKGLSLEDAKTAITKLSSDHDSLKILSSFLADKSVHGIVRPRSRN